MLKFTLMLALCGCNAVWGIPATDNSNKSITQGFYFHERLLEADDVGRSCAPIGAIQCDQKTLRSQEKRGYFYCTPRGSWEIQTCPLFKMCFHVGASDGEHCRFLWNPLAWLAKD